MQYIHILLPEDSLVAMKQNIPLVYIVYLNSNSKLPKSPSILQIPDAANCCTREVEGFSQCGKVSSGSGETGGRAEF